MSSKRKSNTDMVRSKTRERRRAIRAHRFGPLRELVEGSGRVEGGRRVERLDCGHIVPAGPPRQTQPPGKIYRHCPHCPKPPAPPEIP